MAFLALIRGDLRMVRPERTEKMRGISFDNDVVNVSIRVFRLGATFSGGGRLSRPNRVPGDGGVDSGVDLESGSRSSVRSGY